MKKMSVVLLLVACLLMSACSGFGGDIYDSISPPKPSGELYDVQKALEMYIEGDWQFAYPSSGEYRSAVVTEDITGDGIFEAFAFYSTKTDDTTTIMHINYITKQNDEWKSVADIQVAASGVESVEFAKLDNSDTPKLIVNWSKYSSLDKLLSVYSIDTGVLTEIASATYSAYVAHDFDLNGINEIIAIYKDNEKQQATATLMAVDNKGFSVKSSCSLDPFVTAYHTPQISKLTDGTVALFVDADKSTGTVTEVLYIDKGKLHSLFTNGHSNENRDSLRASQAVSMDVDGDGSLDIPLLSPLPAVEGTVESDIVYMTTWVSVGKSGMTPICNSLINYSDCYKFTVPDNWISNFTVTRDIANKERIMYRWDSEISNTGEEIMRIKAVPVSKWNGDETDYREIDRSAQYVFAAKLSNSALTPQWETVVENFNVINDTVK